MPLDAKSAFALVEAVRSSLFQTDLLPTGKTGKAGGGGGA